LSSGSHIESPFGAKLNDYLYDTAINTTLNLRFSWGRVVGIHAYLDTQRVEEACERLAEAGTEEASAPPILG
jgi:hypothetical protein